MECIYEAETIQKIPNELGSSYYGVMVSLPEFSFVESMEAWGVEVHDVPFLVRENLNELWLGGLVKREDKMEIKAIVLPYWPGFFKNCLYSGILQNPLAYTCFLVYLGTCKLFFSE